MYSHDTRDGPDRRLTPAELQRASSHRSRDRYPIAAPAAMAYAGQQQPPPSQQSEYYPRRSLLPYAAPRRGSEEHRHSVLPTDVFPQATDSSESVSTLHAWSVWRTNINQSLASDLVGNKYTEIPVGPFHQHLMQPGDKGEDVYRYSTAVNSGTSLHFAEYINYGIPRARVRKDPLAQDGGGGDDWVGRRSSQGDSYYAANGRRGSDSPRQQQQQQRNSMDGSPGSRPQRR